MKWKDVSLPEKERLANLYIQRLPMHKEAEALNMKYSSLERYLRAYLQHKRMFLTDMAQNIHLPPSPSRLYLDYETIVTDDIVIGADIEIPDYSREYLSLLLLTGMAYGIKKLCIAGDLVATDQQALNDWIKTWRTGMELGFETVIDITFNLLTSLAKWYEEIYIIEGNHDDRIARKTGGEVHLGMLLRGTIAKYSRYSYLWIETSRGPIRVVHPSGPSGFSQDPITLGQKLYNAEPRKCHYVVAHCHRRQDGWSPDGAYEIHSLGAGRDPQRTQYKCKNVTTFKQWDSSFLVVRNGFHYPLDLKSTNWKEVLGELYPIYEEQN